MKKILLATCFLSNFITLNSFAEMGRLDIDKNLIILSKDMQEIYKKWNLPTPSFEKPKDLRELASLADNLKNLETLIKKDNLSHKEVKTIGEADNLLLNLVNNEKERVSSFPESEEKKSILKNLNDFENKVKANKADASLKNEHHYHSEYSISEYISADKKDKLSVLSSIVKSEIKPNKDGKIILGYDEILVLHRNNKELFNEALKDINNNPDKIPGILHSAQKLLNNVALESNLSKAVSDAEIAKLDNNEREILFIANTAQALKTEKMLNNEYEKVKNQTVNNAVENQALLYALSNIKSRLLTNNITGENFGASSGDEQGGSSGAIWVSGTYGHSIQKKNKIFSSYNSNSYGATIGGDVSVNDMVSLGLAYSRINSKFNFKQERAKDKATAKTDAYSIYGQFDNNQLVWSNIASLAVSSTSGKNDRMNIATASSKIKSKAYSFETNLGYKIVQDNINFIPNIGARYLHNKLDGYTEKGAGVYNMNVGGGSLDIISGIIGAKLTSSYQASDDMKIIPSIHAAFEGNYINNISDIQFKYTWMDKYFSTNKMKKKKFLAPSYNAGINLLAKTSIFEASIGYDFNGMKDYQSHQGTLRLKILF